MQDLVREFPDLEDPDLEESLEDNPMGEGSDGEEDSSGRAEATRLFYPKPKSGARGRAASADAAGAAKRRCGTRSPRR